MVNRDKNGRLLPGSTLVKDVGVKGIKSYIRERTNNLREVIDLALELLRNKKTSNRDRIKLIELLLDRTEGKPKQSTEITNSDITIKLPD